MLSGELVEPIILWFRKDLRLDDHPALRAAVKKNHPILPIYVWSPEEEGDWAMGGASMWWLHQSLTSFQAKLKQLGGRLVIKKGPVLKTIIELVRQTRVGAIYFNRHYEPHSIRLEKKIYKELRKVGCSAESFPGNVLFEPWEVQSGTGKPYRVFNPFYRKVLGIPDLSESLPAPRRIIFYKKSLTSRNLSQLNLEPKFDWAQGMRRVWSPGEMGARKELRRFLKQSQKSYGQDRDKPFLRSTSRLSPHLHFGEITPRQIWRALPKNSKSGPFLRQLIWREFAYHLLFHFPFTPLKPLQSQFGKFPWRKNRAALKAWQKGETGYPIVDAGMRELWTTGWMHNRVRLITASFLVKDLLQPWQEGARWFWDTLVDADLANNTLGWQWVAGCGADAAPFFRIFNPVTQGKRFDPQGIYVRKWVPELARVPDKYLHEPWKAPEGDLKKWGVVLGRDYPSPIVDHQHARQKALQTLKDMKK